MLQAVERGRRLDVAWEEAAAGLPPSERRWVHQAVFGSVRLRGRLDHLLDLHLDRGLDSVPPSLVPVLRLGAYQLLYMGSVPDYAAVSQTVEQARSLVGSSLARVVNAVLRSLGREGGSVERFPALRHDPGAHLSTWGSHPRWLVDRWLALFGVEETTGLVEQNNRVPDTFFRPLFIPVDEARRALADGGVASETGPEGSGTVRLERSGRGERSGAATPHEALERVPGIIQDAGAGWVVSWVGTVEGLRLTDLCAAPGGKAVALVARGARVVAADASRSRLMRVGETAARLDIRLPLVAARGEAPPFRPVDVVLVDAPCTGTGTLGRHPDARWRLAEPDIRMLASVQDGILDGAAAVVRPGGLLVYATCTLEPEENEDRIEAFLRRNQGFILEEGVGVPQAVRDGPFLRVLPQRTGTDGAFAARLRRS